MSATDGFNGIWHSVEIQSDGLKLFAEACNSPAIFFVCSKGMTSPMLSDMNSAAKDLFNDGEKLPQGADISLVISELFGEALSSEILETFFRDGEFRGRVQMRSRDVSQSDIVLMRLNPGKSEYLYALIVGLKSADEELLRSYPAMLQRFELSYNMTRHDIQNHISAISSYLELCLRDEQTDVRNQHLARISAIVQDMAKYIRNMGAINPNGVKIEWRRLEDTIHSGLADIALGEVKASIDDGGYELPYDPLLSRVFYNLAYNSISHGKHVRSISVRCEVEGDTLQVIYCDDGTGIDPSARSRLFAPPSDGDRLHALFLIRQILFLHGFTISENGSFGSGVRFEICIPESQFRKAKGSFPALRP